jgi:serine/threonine protein kinase
MTQTGLSLGTPHYMAPEQVMGERGIDGRADVYALGAMTYEMLAGEPPFTGPNSPAVLSRVLTERPRDLRINRPLVPEQVEAAVERALEKLPADRWQTAKEFADALGFPITHSYGYAANHLSEISDRPFRAAFIGTRRMDVIDRLKSTLADRYEIEREIGAGGMATVYLARDLRHNRKVALKVLRPELSAMLGPERFLSEIKVTASLQHPICCRSSIQVRLTACFSTSCRMSRASPNIV